MNINNSGSVPPYLFDENVTLLIMKSPLYRRLVGAALVLSTLAPSLQASQHASFSTPTEKHQQARQPNQIKIETVKQTIALHDKSGMETTISKPGAEYIKVYFSKIVLPEDAYVEVSDADGNEQYHYANAAIQRDQHGLMPAMSISDQTVTVRIVDPSEDFDPRLHGVVIDSYQTPEQPVFGATPSGAMASYTANTRINPACFKTNKHNQQERAQYHYSRPVALIHNNNRGTTGTAWRVGKPIEDKNGLRFLMLTNEHVVKTGNDANRLEVWFDFEHKHCNDQSYYGGRAKMPPLKLGVQKLLISRSGWDYDYHLFELRVPTKDIAKLKSYGYLGLDIESAERYQKIYVPQHGKDENVFLWPENIIKSIATEKRDGRACNIAESVRNGVGGIWHDCETTGGASGSPLIRGDTHTVVGLNNSLTLPPFSSEILGYGASMRDIWKDIAPYFDHKIPESYAFPEFVTEITPEPIVEVVKPEPIIEIVKPEPIIEVVEPEPIVEIIKPEPIVVVVKPETVVEIVTPEPIVEVKPEPIVEVVTPEPSIQNYKNRTKYAMGDIVLQNGVLYQCKQPSVCGSPPFAPGKALSGRAWNVYTAADDKTITPVTTHPAYQMWSTYAMGATVLHNGKAYQCKEPRLCGSPPYAPGKALAHRAWSDVSTTGENTTSAQPVYENFKMRTKYVLDDTVQHNGNLYQCKQPRLCGSPPYAPGKALSSRAWTMSGSVGK